MIVNEEIDVLMQIFLTRKVTLFHACQLLDFHSYLDVGGVPSHACLEKAGLLCTPFETDENDKNNGVWDKVFVNLSDFGFTFANGGRSVPNPYGPILICINPEVLSEAIDVAVCLKSAGEPNFDRGREALNLEDIERLFEFSVWDGYPKSTYIKYRKKLRDEFSYESAADPEISCFYENGKIPLKYIEKVIVDPYVINGRPLAELVKTAIAPFNRYMKIPVYERSYNWDSWFLRKPFYNKLALSIYEKYPLFLPDLLREEGLDRNIMLWAKSIQNLNLGYQFRRYMQYLYEGTLIHSV